ncbi:protein of unknown function [Maridesulfovibrio ferrireducens]|uniref:Uncharacterized protein n=1 Tax=Maridesulfovibrio ferrireducens TaxID=246191 RepID=A0A1G9B405_9BACT|nr:DUF697 domain-containing protein [Maridesulfovibrio ferrireducens]SDK34271.1 protein of unknown function [Maridesulfovibrio ferrireducens]
MSKTLTRLISAGMFLLLAGFILFMLNQISALAQLCASYFPQSYDYILFGLSGLFLIICISPLVMFIFRPGPLTMPDNPTPAEQEKYIRKLCKRLRSNKHVRKMKLNLSRNEDLDLALNGLDEISTEKMKSVASRIFLSTAISQNGKLDSFIVLGSLTKLVWDVSKIYNQRPSLRDMISVYSNVAVTAFFASAVEDLDIQSQIEAIMSPVLAGSALGMIPGAGGLTSIITASILDGSTNAFLALRVGIITRGHFSYRADKKTAGYRRGVLKEAAGLLLSIAVNSTKMITSAYLKTITRSAGDKAMSAARKVVDSKDKAFEATGKAARYSARQAQKVAHFASFSGKNKEEATEPDYQEGNSAQEENCDHDESATSKKKSVLGKLFRHRK